MGHLRPCFPGQKLEASFSSASLLIAFQYLIYWNVHTLYFHPLARFPGPKSWIISRIPFFFALRAGTYMQRITTLHAKYGPIIRIGVNELSFTDGRAWEEIYAMKAGMEKNPNWCPAPKNGVRGILTANKADHARYRHLLAPVFSEKALREQEPIIQKYISLMISKLKEEEIKAPSKPVDLVKWTEYTVFDLMGELSLGESFHSLDNADHRPFVAGFIKNLQAVMYIISSNYLPEVRAVLLWLVPKKVWINHIKHSEYVGHQVRARLAEGDNPHKPDFITWLCRFSNTDNVGMSIPEIESNVGTILIAGSETTATSITGIIFELLKHPESFAELAREIREKFRYECDINSQSTQKLTFLNAVIEEGLRYCAPAPAFGSRVVPNQGAQICSEWIPGGVSSKSSAPYPLTPKVLSRLTDSIADLRLRRAISLLPLPSQLLRAQRLQARTLPRSGKHGRAQHQGSQPLQHGQSQLHRQEAGLRRDASDPRSPDLELRHGGHGLEVALGGPEDFLALGEEAGNGQAD